MKKVGIVLVNYKNYAKRYLKECRDSLYEQNYEGAIKIYIVDNDSNNKSKTYLQKIYPEAHIITRKDGNYVAANNLGFKKAIEDGCDYLVSLNMDTIVDDNWIKQLVLVMENNIQAGIVQSKILLHNQENRINTLGNIIHFLAFGFTSYYKEKDADFEEYPQEIKGYASGCSFMIKTEVFKEIGGYIEEYYMYHDDMELSMKVKLAGYKILLAHKSVVYHKYEFSRSIRMLYYMERNRLLTIFIFYPLYLKILIIIPFIIMQLGMIMFSIFGGWFRTQFKVIAYFFKQGTWSIIKEERRKIKKIQKLKFGVLAKNFSGTIQFQEIANPLLKYIANPFMFIYWWVVKNII